MLVFDYEKEKLRNIGYDDLAEQVKWIANIDDSKGYDIESFEVNKNGQINKIYIEVKTTEGDSDSPFFLSKHERERIDELRNNYYIYRVFNISSCQPNFFIIGYENFVSRLKVIPELYKVDILN